MPRKALPLIAALFALVVPATAEAGYMAKRVPVARIADGHAAPRHHSRHDKRHHRRAARARAAEDGCANADLVPARGNLDEVRDAILCLHNRVRAEHGLPPLREQSRLRRAAAAHSDDMVGRRYFDHTAPGGRTMVDRIVGAGYVRARDGWMLGENLEWGTGRLSTPRGAVRAWLDSAPHRENLLKRGYREVGIGISLGVPNGRNDGATYTVDFGTRL